MSTEPTVGAEPPGPAPDEQEYQAPSELESALLTLVLFGGLVVFAIGCMTFLW
ncbi:hypothetical protein M3148_12415 [Georgenia satyanarayanai]|uniref:hypothetical protein n=1 Tax=Georgenia satyanarayanai TaxID=860221 RepID=UPI00203BF80B|nr:hypothetical protein [Georgenia satyanarayanai]MCM3661784.1 hypothetical protein [Georgenia satyanarayanai]